MPSPTKPVPTNPAAASVAAAVARAPGPNGAPPPVRRFSDEMRVLLGKHAAERSELDTAHWNERVDMTERQAAEVAAQTAKDTPAE